MDSLLKIAELKGIPAAAEGSNFVFSPLSLRAALSLTAAGAKGETLRQLLSFLGSPTVDHLHSASARLVEAVREREGDGQLLLSFVNGVWVDRSVRVNPSFVRIAASIYDAAADSVDFIHQAPLEEKKINNWIEEKTNGVIKDLIPEGTVKNTTILILANALYFKGKWQEKFDSSMTENDNFYLLDGNNIVVPFMSSREDQLISSYNGFKVLKLPYKQQGDNQGNKRFSMLLFLPNERNGLHDLIRRAASEPSFFNEHIPFKRVEVHRFMIPKFKISFSCETTDVLSNLGLKSLFNWADADLSGMCLKSKRLCVSSMHHKAAVEVDEEGTVAAAATSITTRLTCYTPRVNFVADHPFMFILREDATGIIFAKELLNSPANVLIPAILAEEASKVASMYSDVFTAKILDVKQCMELKMGSYLGVAAASSNPPHFIHLCYKPPNGDVKMKLAIVGKGLTFDSGGYNIKIGPACSIDLMKFDMGGSAAAFGAAKAIGQIKPPGVEVHFIVAACENMISGTGMRPGDIVTASNGKTIEVNNTDAEGRLTLADALVYACDQGVQKIVDLATLTGACIVALGSSIAGIFTPSDELAVEITAAAMLSGEKFWRMPLVDSYWELMKSSVADMVNSGGREGGAILTALFLKQFVDEKVQWMHIDLAGPVWNEKKRLATGFGVSTLVEWVQKNSFLNQN